MNSRRRQESALETKPPSGNRRKFAALGFVLVLIAAGCLAYWLLNRGFATTDDAQIDGDIYTVAARIPGRVASVPVADNAHVTAGQVLVLLDDGDQQAALAKAQADEAQAEAQLDVAKAQLVEAAAQVQAADATQQQAAQDFARFQRVNQRAITQQQSDAVAAAIRGAKAKSAAAQATQAATEASITVAEAQVKAAQSEVKSAQLQLSYTRIVAPASGFVATKTVEPGNVVAVGTGLMAITGDDVWVTANYKETQLGAIHPGAKATIKVDALPGVTFNAHVDSLQHGTGAVFSLLPAQNATGNYIKIIQRVPVKIVFDDDRVKNYFLSPGMSAEPSITIDP